MAQFNVPQRELPEQLAVRPEVGGEGHKTAQHHRWEGAVFNALVCWASKGLF